VAPPSFPVELALRRGGVVPLRDDIPFLVGRVPLLLSEVIEGKKVSAGVVKHPVYDYANTPIMRRVEQHEEQRVCRSYGPCVGVGGLIGHEGEVTGRIRPEIGVDMMEEIAVILVLRPCPEQRVEIHSIDAQIDQIVEAVYHALQISAITSEADGAIEIVGHGHLPGLTREPIRCPIRDLPTVRDVAEIGQTLARWNVRGVTVPESLRKYLVPDGLLGPRRYFWRGICRIGALGGRAGGDRDGDYRQGRQPTGITGPGAHRTNAMTLVTDCPPASRR